MRGKAQLIAGLVVALVVAGGAYAAGHSAGQDDGYAAGRNDGDRRTAARYERGTPAYRAIYERGRAHGHAAGERTGEREGERTGEREGERTGERAGFERGREVGLQRGEQEGAASGAQAVLGGFGDWDDGAYYVVTVQPGGQSGVPYRIASRTSVQPLTDYRLCEHDEGRLCSLPVVVASGG